MAESKGGKYVQMGFDFNFGGDGDGSQSHSSPSYSPSLGFVPNLYHHPIFAFGQTPNGGDGLIDACPGSGKTTTLLEFVRRLPKELEQSVLIVAFSKQIADELQPRLRQTGLAQRSSSVNGKCLVSSSTIHSLGLATLRHYLLRGGGGNSGVAGVVGARSSYGGKGNKGNNGNVTRPLPLLDESKYEKLAQIYLGKRQLNAKDYLYPVTELIRLAQLTLTDPNDEAAMKALTLRYDLIEALRFWETVLVATRDLLERGKEVALEEHRINFEDMLWLPYVLDLTPPEQFQWVFVDEYQDLSRAQFELVMRCRAAAAEGEGGGGGGGRMLFVGDHHQSIFGFNCAEIGIKQLILKRTNATEFPLPISYRCPRSTVELADTIYPGSILAAPNAKKGAVIEDLTEDELAGVVKAGDLILCRTTAPLIKICFELIREGIKARVRGKDIGRNLRAILTPLEKAEKEGGFIFNRNSFLAWLELEEEKRVEVAYRIILSEGASPSLIETIHDKLATLQAIFLSAQPQPKSVTELKDVISQIFSDKIGTVWLSSVHRAKGLEAKRVFILRPYLMPFPKATLGWERVQESNVLYVAVTRNREQLYIIHREQDREPDQDQSAATPSKKTRTFPFLEYLQSKAVQKGSK